MERECCLSMLIALIGGTLLLACGWWPAGDGRAGAVLRLEQAAWWRIWAPLVPALTAAAILCGWALTEPDPVPERVPVAIIVASVPFVLLCARAAVRAVRSLAGGGEPAGPVTVGLLRPWIVVSPHLAKKLSDRQIAAALEHERAHARHRDPLRIWLAQFASDLQWPWPQARDRLRRWLIALELARDEEARMAGIDGSELAEALVASARFSRGAELPMQAALIGGRAVLRERVERLLAPRESSQSAPASARTPLLMLAPAVVLGLALGLLFGEQMVRALFWIAA